MISFADKCCSYFFNILILNTLSIYREVGLRDYMVVLVLVFQRIFIQFFITIQNEILTNHVQGFLLLYIATNSCYLSSF
jgi:hypothetical protein